MEENNKLIAKFMGVEYSDELNYDKSWLLLKQVLRKMRSPLRTKIFGVYREPEGEIVKIIIHNFSLTKRYIVFKFEYGRRFKEIIEYRQDGETMIEPTYRLIIEFMKWYKN